ncbi:MAG: GHMP kinase [bacterium]
MRLHRLAGRLFDCDAPPHLARFQSALDRLRALGTETDPLRRSFFAPNVPVHIARAPGRLDVMGGIADYSGATVLQLPLDCATVTTLQRQHAPRCDLLTYRAGEWAFFTIDVNSLISGELNDPLVLARWFADRGADHWASYVVGTIQRCLHHAKIGQGSAQPGLRMLIESNVPEGKGVSSSAALEVATEFAAVASYGFTLTPEQIAVDCQWVENHVVGAPCGIMDQMTSACGRSDRLMRLTCQPGTIEGHIEIPAGFKFFGIDSGLRHAVTGADYGTVRTGAFMGYRIIAAAAGLREEFGVPLRLKDPKWGGYLANMSVNEFATRFERVLPVEMDGSEFLDRYHGITDTATRVDPARRYPVRQATRHPVFEQRRVEEFAELLAQVAREPQAAIEMGHMMKASHESYSACGLGSDGTDRLVELVAMAGPERGLFGAKITGGGSGGTVAVFGRDDAEPIVREIANRYAAETGRAAQVFAKSGPGADESGVLCVDPHVDSPA